MKHRIILLLLVFAVVFGSVSHLQAQFLWQIEHTDNNGRYYYAFDAISCSGDNCTASGQVIDTIDQSITVMFWRSSDGGITWNMQDPGLPLSYDLRNRNHFNVIQQIDSLNVIAGGNAGYFVHTLDGGKSWPKLDSVAELVDFHFSDSLTGIVLARGNFIFQGTIVSGIGEVAILTTTDGGKSWKTTLLHGFNPDVPGALESCHSYGNGKFRVYKSELGPVYTTYDNWETVDSTKLLFDVKKDTITRHYYMTRCNFTGGDTLIASGIYNGGNANIGLILMRSTDAGANWEAPLTFPKNIVGIYNMTSLDRDTVLATCQSNNKILMSTDRGVSWRVDSLLLDTNYDASGSNGIQWTKDGHPVAIFANLGEIYGSPSILARGVMIKSDVGQIDPYVFKPHVYPNPASSFINLSALDPQRPIHIIDIYGREVLRSVTTDQGTQLIDISSLPRGVYDVLLDRNGRLLNAGKIAVIGK